MRAFLALVLLLGATSADAQHIVGSPSVFADSVPGPEGLAFARGGRLVVGTAIGQILRFRADGTREMLADVGEPLGGITVLKDGRVLAASFAPGRVWSVDPTTNVATVFATGVAGANYIVETRLHQILVSASSAGTILDITSGTPMERASGLTFPNGLAIFRGYLYVAETVPGDVVRFPLARDGSLGPREPYATGANAADGIGFDHRGHLLVVGADTLRVVPAGGGVATVLSTDPLLDWPSNLAFGHGGHGFLGRDLYLANFGLPLGSGTQILRLRYAP